MVFLPGVIRDNLTNATHRYIKSVESISKWTTELDVSIIVTIGKRSSSQGKFIVHEIYRIWQQHFYKFALPTLIPTRTENLVLLFTMKQKPESMNTDTLRGSIKSTKLSAKDIMIPTNKIQLSPRLDALMTGWCLRMTNTPSMNKVQRIPVAESDKVKRSRDDDGSTLITGLGRQFTLFSSG